MTTLYKKISLISIIMCSIINFSSAEQLLVDNSLNNAIAALLTGVDLRVLAVAKKILPEQSDGPNLISQQVPLHSKINDAETIFISQSNFLEVVGAAGLCSVTGIIKINNANSRFISIVPIIRNNDKIVVGFANINSSGQKNEIYDITGYVWCNEAKPNDISIARLIKSADSNSSKEEMKK